VGRAGVVGNLVNLVKIIKMSRLTIEIEPEQHRQIKTMATFAGMTIKDFILAKTLGGDAGEEPDATDHLLSSPENAKRLLEAISTPRANYRSFESMEELRNALGI
jgi:uncharacterized protein (DUF1778 family)